MAGQMYVIVWKFEVPLESDEEFRSAYGRDGEWAKLFARHDGFVGTELIAIDEPGQYLTIDRWESAEAFDAFMEQNRVEYEQLDERFEALTEAEDLVGSGERR
ncbi:MAG TPA: antibiotic biosynthesis monooxygenase [Acidimicrobiia bacterium]